MWRQHSCGRTRHQRGVYTAHPQGRYSADPFVCNGWPGRNIQITNRTMFRAVNEFCECALRNAIPNKANSQLLAVLGSLNFNRRDQ
jgi:hypothetical protein